MATAFVPRLLASLTIAAVLAFALAGTSLSGVLTAQACSIVTPHDVFMPETVHRSPIVAIGRWEDSQQRVATFVVEHPLKGAESGDRLRVDNRTTYTAMACSPYDEPFREGYRFPSGERAVLLLEKEVDGLWQISHLSLAVFEVPDSLDAGMEGIGWYFGDPEAGTPTDVKLSTIIEATGYEGAVSLEPGDPSADVAPWVPVPTSAVGITAPTSESPGWLGLALGALLFAAPVAWQWRRPA
jgi:hypothetical protein